jgi:hypothetical protein
MIVFSLIGRSRRKGQSQPPRRREPARPRLRPFEPVPRAQIPTQKPRIELPPAWQPAPRQTTPEPEIEVGEWGEADAAPAPWSAQERRVDEMPSYDTDVVREDLPVRVLLERLTAAATSAASPAAEVAVTAAPIVRRANAESQRLRDLRAQLASSASLRDALLLREILGPPKGRR